ncbi:uncharacterized protein LOC121791118 [Salvia splendens]|uniref:uncharacterized protein LOC121791118 n=1 Tax=Salvia splendens TaxID=180675 RepID=UPI001C25AB6B|nr:uncharacterized protein LOC121791118 [Salvia splendens]
MEQSPNNGTKKVKLLCSYGGQIKSRPSDHHLSYLGDTKIVAVDRAVKILPILRQAQIPPLRRRRDIVKYQLPGEDLDALVSLIDDDDVEHMIDRVENQPASPDPARSLPGSSRFSNGPVVHRVRLLRMAIRMGTESSPFYN